MGTRKKRPTQTKGHIEGRIILPRITSTEKKQRPLRSLGLKSENNHKENGCTTLTVPTFICGYSCGVPDPTQQNDISKCYGNCSLEH